MQSHHTNKRGRFARQALRGLFGHRHGHGPFGGGGFGPDGDERHGPGGFGPGGFGAGGPGGRRGKRFSGDELRLMVLTLLAEGPQHGYQLIRAFTEKSADAYTPSPGVLYPLLSLRADMGLAEEIAKESEGVGGARRSFALTEAGKAEIEAKKAEIEAAFGRLAAMAEHASRTDAAPVRRAMMNLRTATVQRLTRDGGDSELALRIAKLLDDAAQAIERL